eukprot:Gb_27850 [translate_table: standard]
MSMACVPHCTHQNPIRGFKDHRLGAYLTSSQRLRNNFPSHGRNSSLAPAFSYSPERYIRQQLGNYRIVCSAASAAGGSSANSDENPYKVLGVSPIERFDMIKVSYTKKYKDAERRGDEASMAQLERAYDKIMMAQLSNRKQGLTFGSVEVSKDIRYADKQPIIPWGPRYARSGQRDILINLGISTFFAGWMAYAGSADWKPLQFLIFGYIFRIFEKLKAFEPPENVEDESRGIRTGKRLLRTLGLVFSCIAISSLAYTGVLNIIEFIGFYIPRALINGQELFVTISSAVMLFFLGSYYR